MNNRSKHMPYYVIIIGFLLMSLGFNFIQYEEIFLLRKENKVYSIFFEYLYLLKIEQLQNESDDLVYKD
jgi:hypothetical protein